MTFWGFLAFSYDRTVEIIWEREGMICTKGLRVRLKPGLLQEGPCLDMSCALYKMIYWGTQLRWCNFKHLFIVTSQTVCLAQRNFETCSNVGRTDPQTFQLKDVFSFSTICRTLSNMQCPGGCFTMDRMLHITLHWTSI